ncbi:MAG: tail fiber protein [Moorea sp. SIO4A3]|nr:tail fiber protein [Moorena sp. SIO4A3]
MDLGLASLIYYGYLMQLDIRSKKGYAGNTDLVIRNDANDSCIKLKAQDNQSRIVFNKETLRIDTNDQNENILVLYADLDGEKVMKVYGEVEVVGGRYKGKGAVPVGTVVPYAGKEVPVGWMRCDGRKISKEEYPELWSTLGEEDAEGMKEVPNLKGRVIAGWDPFNTYYEDMGKKGGMDEIQLSLGQLPYHKHAIEDHDHHLYGDKNQVDDDDDGDQGWTIGKLNAPGSGTYLGKTTGSKNPGSYTLDTTLYAGESEVVCMHQPYQVCQYIIYHGRQ